MKQKKVFVTSCSPMVRLRASERYVDGVRPLVGRIEACVVCLWSADVEVRGPAFLGRVRRERYYCERCARQHHYIVDARDDEASGPRLRLMQVRR